MSRIGAEKFGDWEKVARVISSLAEEMETSYFISAQRVGLKAEGIAKSHISSQDLPWRPLNPKYLATKVKQGKSENILVASSDYFQAITSFVDRQQGVVMVGVKKEAKNSNGDILADIARTLEFGSDTRRIPERPLWRPTLQETVEWFKSSDSTPEKILMQRLKRYT